MRLFIFFSFICAYILMALPIGPELSWWRPEFIVLLVIYWTLFESLTFRLMGAWLAGLFQDLLEMGTLGINAMSMLLIAYIIHLIYKRLRNYAVWHQALLIFFLVGIFQLFSNWLSGIFTSTVTTNPKFLIAALMTSLSWPLLVFLLGRMKLYLHLSQ